MLYDSRVITELKKVIGWKDQLWTGVPALGAPLNDTEIGQYYQSVHSALRLDYIDALKERSRDLGEYLDEVEAEAIQTLLNTIQTSRQLGNDGNTISTNDVIYELGSKTASVTNESRFCGVMFSLKHQTGISAVINRVGLYLTSAVTDLELYLFHSSQGQKVNSYVFTTNKNNSFSWQEIRIQLEHDTSSISGGTWYLGYYQDDLGAQASQAVSYTAMNWQNGYCGTCDNGVKQGKYETISSKLAMKGFYVPSASLPIDKDESFNPDVVIKTNTNNWGFNFNISVGCNLSQFWIDNRRTLANCIGLSVAKRVLEDMKFSSQINNIEQSVRVMIVRDLEGAADTGSKPLHERLSEAIEGLKLDEGNLHKDCLPCARKPKTSYKAIG